MSNVIVLTDSSAYLPNEIVEQYPIAVLPLTLIWEGEPYRDGVDILPDEFYTRLSKSESLPQTSQVTVHQFQEMFQKYLDEGYEVLAELKESLGADEAILTHVSPVVGAHVGPGAISIAFMAG